MLLDTCYLIDLQQELRAEREGEARLFLRRNADVVFSISVITVTEFLEGFENIAEGDRFLRPFVHLDIDFPICREASRIRRHLRGKGKLIGDFDILLAATSKASGLPLVTEDVDHFTRVPDMKLVSYRKAAS